MNILTVDLEDWNHILDYRGTAATTQWSAFAPRLEENVERLLQLFDGRGLKATWFTLGWIARKNPSLIRTISIDHEIACHSDIHTLVYNQTPEIFFAETVNAKKSLEDITGKEVTAYRAPGFSITEKCKWAFEKLAEAGFKSDASIFPGQRNHGGYKDFGSSVPIKIKTESGSLMEFPVNYYRLLNKKIFYSGGGYFRLYPYPAIKKMMEESDYVMTYFHPRDFDPDQPLLTSLSLKRKFMSYTGIRNAEVKLQKLLTDFKFVDMRTAVQLIDWSKVNGMEL